MIVDIRDDDTLKLSKGMDKEAIELPREPKKKQEGATNLGDGVYGHDLEGGFQFSPDSASHSAKDNTVVGSSSLALVAPGIYILECGLTR